MCYSDVKRGEDFKDGKTTAQFQKSQTEFKHHKPIYYEEGIRSTNKKYEH